MNVTINIKRLFGRGFAAYLSGSAKNNGKAKVVIDIDAMLNCCVANKSVSFKQLFSDSVQHEINHAIEDLFNKTFSERRVNAAINKARR